SGAPRESGCRVIEDKEQTVSPSGGGGGHRLEPHGHTDCAIIDAPGAPPGRGDPARRQMYDNPLALIGFFHDPRVRFARTRDNLLSCGAAIAAARGAPRCQHIVGPRQGAARQHERDEASHGSSPRTARTSTSITRSILYIFLS